MIFKTSRICPQCNSIRTYASPIRAFADMRMCGNCGCKWDGGDILHHGKDPHRKWWDKVKEMFKR